MIKTTLVYEDRKTFDTVQEVFQWTDANKSTKYAFRPLKHGLESVWRIEVDLIEDGSFVGYLAKD